MPLQKNGGINRINSVSTAATTTADDAVAAAVVAADNACV